MLHEVLLLLYLLPFPPTVFKGLRSAESLESFLPRGWRFLSVFGRSWVYLWLERTLRHFLFFNSLDELLFVHVESLIRARDSGVELLHTSRLLDILGLRPGGSHAASWMTLILVEGF